MKKNLLLAAFLMGSYFTVNAQDVILSQDFEGTPTGWSVLDFDGDESTFGLYNSSTGITALGFTGKVAGSGNFTVANNAAVPAPDTDNAIWTPEVEIPTDVTATFSLRMGSADVEDGAVAPYEIYVLTAEDVADFTDETTIGEIMEVLDAKTPIASGTAANPSTVENFDLTDFAGQTISVIIRHRDTDGLAYLFIDDATFTTQETAGLKDVTASKLSVYPNPATNVVTVNGADALVNNVAIVDINGRTVKSVKFAGVAEAQVNVSDLASGVYVMTIASDKGTTTQKIVKN
ncbi:T9SS type A sorting domain-containing protein [Flavobacterium zepuense]|nr:T9SS type A sorting domain-containing protein [Flavobacterium zepuense]